MQSLHPTSLSAFEAATNKCNISQALHQPNPVTITFGIRTNHI